MVSSQVDQFSADLGRSQPEEEPGRVGTNLAETAMKPHHRPLQHVVGLRPPPHTRIIPQHSPGQATKPLAGMLDDLVTGHGITLPKSLEQSVEFGVWFFVWHPSAPSPRSRAWLWLLAQAYTTVTAISSVSSRPPWRCGRLFYDEEREARLTRLKNLVSLISTLFRF